MSYEEAFKRYIELENAIKEHGLPNIKDVGALLFVIRGTMHVLHKFKDQDISKEILCNFLIECSDKIINGIKRNLKEFNISYRGVRYDCKKPEDIEAPCCQNPNLVCPECFYSEEVQE